MDKQFSAFTTRFSNLSNQLVNYVTVSGQGKQLQVSALWDTGATNSCISHDVVKTLGLVPTGKAPILTPSGKAEVNTYLVDIILPNSTRIADIIVFDSEIGAQGIGALIGMNIITLGDFSVTNANGFTVFSFRVPSIEHNDYAKQASFIKTIGPTHGKGKRKRK